MKREARPLPGHIMTVPDAGQKYFGLSRNAAYEAARRGDLPVIRIGGRIFAVVAALERMIDPPSAATTTTGTTERERGDR
jgi:hypothetical protein